MANCKQLLSEINHCQRCETKLPLPPKPIFQFSQHSKLLIAGQAPGIVTHNKGRPFDDKSGERLRAWLGVDIDSFYRPENFAILPMGFCYPGKGKSGDLPPIPLCAQTWRTAILAQLSDLKLTLLIGKYAIDWHLRGTNIGYRNLTDAVKHYDTLLAHQLIALPHPSPRNNLWLKKNPWFEQDIIPILQQRVSLILSK